MKRNCSRHTPFAVAAFVLATLFLGVAIAEACNVPVFRFALERWRPDPYRVVLFHRGALTDEQRKLANSLADQQDQAVTNLLFRTVDLDALENEDRKAALDLFATQKDPPLPWLTTQYPVHLGIQKPIWSGPLSSESIATLTDSPLRKELAKRLGDGQTAVWLLLESGKKSDDDAAATLVLDELKKLEEELKLPELSDSPDDRVRPGVPLQIAFSLLRVSRDNPAEQALVRMLIDSESDLAERSEPMVFPVFGRGRALFGLVGAGVTADNVRGAAAFLTGACSCEVKELNPGFDILLATDWDNFFADDGGQFVAAANRGMKAPAAPEFVLIPPGSEPSPAAAVETVDSKPTDSSDSQSCETCPLEANRGWILTALAVIGVVGVGLAMKRRRATV